jgi:hypothetical protein
VIGWEGLPRLAEAIRRFTGSEEIVPPGFLVGVDPPEFQFLKNVRLWTTGLVTVAANAGNVSHIEVANPGSSLIVVVTKAKVLNPFLNASYLLTLNGAAAATPAQNTARDTRQSGNIVQSINRIANNTVGTSGISIDEVFAGVAGTTLYFDGLPFVLTPNLPLGNRLGIFNTTQNSPLTVVIEGYEYNARAEELAL